jgi:hypothetical protein
LAALLLLLVRAANDEKGEGNKGSPHKEAPLPKGDPSSRDAPGVLQLSWNLEMSKGGGR